MIYGWVGFKHLFFGGGIILLYHDYVCIYKYKYIHKYINIRMYVCMLNTMSCHWELSIISIMTVIHTGMLTWLATLGYKCDLYSLLK